MGLKGIKTNTQKEETKGKPQTNGKYKIRPLIAKTMKYTHNHIQHQKKTKQSPPPKKKYNRLAQKAKETKNDINQLKMKLIAQTGKQNQIKVPTGE